MDAKRGKLFSKLIKEITVAAKQGGGNPEGNARLRAAIDRAKEVNMPAENIKRAIQKGTGELPGMSFEETTYEGYGPGGVAILLEVMTDNKNRTTAEIRHLFAKHGGNLGEAGCVAWMFHKKGHLLVSKAKIDEERLMALALEAGAEDLKTDEEEHYEVMTQPADFERVKQALLDQGMPLEHAELSMIPQSTVHLEGREAEQLLRLMDLLEDHDDVQQAYANFDIPNEIIAKVEG